MQAVHSVKTLSSGANGHIVDPTTTLTDKFVKDKDKDVMKITQLAAVPTQTSPRGISLCTGGLHSMQQARQAELSEGAHDSDTQPIGVLSQHRSGLLHTMIPSTQLAHTRDKVAVTLLSLHIKNKAPAAVGLHEFNMPQQS